jgi:hypothetical protein
MRNKVLPLTCMAILMLIFFFTSQDPDQGAPPTGREATERRSTNVVMAERSPGSGRTLQIRAGEVVETDDQVVRFSDFLLVQEGGLRLSGPRASYDRKSSVLTIPGPLKLETADGARVHIDGLRWDRVKDVASTENPVRFEGRDSIMTADRAAFSEGFATIELTGRVHAKILQNILDL